ncbi:hypothetical protein [Oricola thermophila]|uniref:Uncharacterized protein n=1 Tax=Oricola thermophila TaxID=2742145 RepID=A0A6N1VJC2_9HYPH|nr:hypothetical protein [Oricola thermophila]QKV18987.1 hypothetical protein HTY61_11250 [Oricola thermophila]
MEKKNSEYNLEFWRELKRRTRVPLSDLTFIFYLVFGVVVFSGFGVVVELVKHSFAGAPFDVSSLTGVRAALSVFYPALIGAATLQLTLEAVKKSESLMVVFAITSLLVMLGFAVFHGIQEFRQESQTQVFWFSVILSVFGIWIWTIANADNPDLKTKPRNDDAVGGGVNRKLKGSTEGFVQ